jgi:molybdate transport system regulatory protein
MARTKAPPPKPRARLSPRVKVWIEAEGGYGFGSGLIEILQAVDRAGSIKAAADDLGRSYRHVWDRIKDAERAVGRTLVETQVGGQGAHRSDLTDAARKLVVDFLAIRGRMIEVMEREFARRFG